MQDKQTIAIFDFDGTITTKDTLFDFIVFSKSRFKLYTGLIYLSPILILYKLSVIKNEKAKEILFSFFFKNNDYYQFKELGKKYITRIEAIIHQDSRVELEKYKENKTKIVIVSASIKEWIEPWATKNGIQVISTNIEVENNKITGRFSSRNCYGIEKVNRLKKVFPNREDYYLIAYGDSNGDNELLKYADTAIRYKR